MPISWNTAKSQDLYWWRNDIPEWMHTYPMPDLIAEDGRLLIATMNKHAVRGVKNEMDS